MDGQCPSGLSGRAEFRSTNYTKLSVPWSHKEAPDHHTAMLDCSVSQPNISLKVLGITYISFRIYMGRAFVILLVNVGNFPTTDFFIVESWKLTSTVESEVCVALDVATIWRWYWSPPGIIVVAWPLRGRFNTLFAWLWFVGVDLPTSCGQTGAIWVIFCFYI